MPDRHETEPVLPPRRSTGTFLREDVGIRDEGKVQLLTAVIEQAEGRADDARKMTRMVLIASGGVVLFLAVLVSLLLGRALSFGGFGLDIGTQATTEAAP